MLGFSIYPHHLKDGTSCSLKSFCEMISEAALKYGSDRLGIGSDLCQDQPDSVVTWMRTGRWSKEMDYGEGSAENPGFPTQPSWFKDNTDFSKLADGLSNAGFSPSEVNGIMGENWIKFYKNSFGACQNE